ncbi:MAG: response regulator, partial [Lachnospiraceae bacterium]|nr:response regulator [Lachnospiraceae bacterium]
MNILIVDDEKLTRCGLISSVEWTLFGTCHVEGAANGAEALEITAGFVPDIVITDVRMPRMNGIEMAWAMQKRYPDISFIIMSGYSDREYLKEAIKLNAVSFIEKPISIPEVEEAVRAAADKLAEKRLAERGHFVREVEESRRISGILMRRPAQDAEIDTSFFPDMEKDGNFCCIVTEFARSVPPVSYGYLTDVNKKTEEKLSSRGLRFVSLLKDEKHICFFLYSRNISKKDAVFAVKTIREDYAGTGKLTIAVGDIVKNIRNSYESYNSAVTLLQQAFYCEENSDILGFEVTLASPPIIKDRTA